MEKKKVNTIKIKSFIITLSQLEIKLNQPISKVEKRQLDSRQLKSYYILLLSQKKSLYKYNTLKNNNKTIYN